MFDARRDASGGPAKVRPVEMSVQQTVSGPVLVLSPDPAFFADPKLRYPVTIDPTLVYGRASDTFIQASNGNTNFGGSVGLWTGTTNGGPDRSRSLVTFGTSNMTGRHILSATMGVWNFASGACLNSGTSGNPMFVHRITTPWDPATVTWNNNTASYAATAEARVDKSLQGIPACPVGTVTADVTAVVQAWANGTVPNYGLLMKANNESDSAGYRRYYSGDHNGGQPSLTVNYNTYPATIAGRFMTPATVSGTTTYANVTRPTLHGAAWDPDGGTTRVDFEIWNAAGTTLVASGSSATVAENTNVGWAPGVDLADGAYEWRARGFDGTDFSKVWSSWVPFTVDTTVPAAPAGLSSSQYPVNVWTQTGADGTFSWTETSTDVAGYVWGLDVSPPATAVAGTSVTVSPMPGGWHTLSVQAVDRAGNRSSVAAYSFGATAGLTSPTDGGKTQGSVTLTARTAPGSTAVTYNWRRSPTDGWAAVPAADVTNGGVGIGGWPVAFSSGSGDSIPPPLVWNLAHSLSDQDGPVQVQVCFGAACSTTPVDVTLDETAYGEAYATTEVAGGTLSLLTGNLAVGETDASVPAFGTTLSVGRTFNTHAPAAPASGIFGPGWTPALPVDEAGSDFTGATDTGAAVSLTGSDGSVTAFSKTTGGYTPTGDNADSGITLTAAGGNGNGPATFTLADLDGNSTVFSAAAFGSPPSPTSPHGYAVSSVSQPGSAQTTTFTYTSGRPTRILAPVPPGGTCTDPASAATWTPGCRALTFGYDGNQHLSSVTLVTNPGSSVLQVDVACYSYDGAGRLAQAWDPRDGTAGTGGHPVACGTPVLATGYGYDTGTGRLTSITPPGLAAWNLGYDGTGRLSTVARTHNPSFGGGTETTTIAYGLPLTADGAHPEYRPDMTSAAVAGWAQTDTPVTATAVFGPAMRCPRPTCATARCTTWT